MSNKKLITNLGNVREYINVLQQMLLAKQRNIDDEIKLVTNAKKGINEVLFELTGNEFYQKQGGKQNVN